MRKTDPTHKIEPTKFDWWLQRVGGSRKPPPISLPRIRALEMPAEPATQSSRKGDHPNEKGGTNAAQSSTITGVQTVSYSSDSRRYMNDRCP
ncbi:MAG: hypothetical protein WBL84_28025, partial [Xanthobacteraceae bacterium]